MEQKKINEKVKDNLNFIPYTLNYNIPNTEQGVSFLSMLLISKERLVVKTVENSVRMFVLLNYQPINLSMSQLKKLSNTFTHHQTQCQQQEPPLTMVYDTAVDPFDLSAPPTKKRNTKTYRHLLTE